MREQPVEIKSVPNQTPAAGVDVFSKLYRDIGISALAAALEASKISPVPKSPASEQKLARGPLGDKAA